MIKFFNVNNPTVTLFLFLYVIVLNLVLFIEPAFFAVPQTSAPFSQLFFHLTEILFNNNHYVLSVITVIMLFVQALMLNSLMGAAKLFDTVTFVPSVVYVTAVCLFREFLFLSPALLSMTFIIPALGKTLKFFRQQRCFAEVFDMGFLTGVAGLFYKPAFLLVVLLFIALAVMRSFNWREWAIGFSGFVSIIFLTGTFYYLTDKLPVFMQGYILSATVLPGSRFSSVISLSLIAGYTAILAFAAVIIFLLNFLKSAVLARKFVILAWWAFLLLFLPSLFPGRVTLHHFVVLCVPLSIVISYLFVNIRRVRIANIIHYGWVAVVLFFQYYKG
ncbi:MAG TPA: hypothetical protein VNJ07_02575 [Chitinophagales bacterium]|nr:hypothetical protein [Chitinophagales bacterium]